MTGACVINKNTGHNDKPITKDLNVNHNDKFVEVWEKKLRLLRVCISRKKEIVIRLKFAIPTSVVQVQWTTCHKKRGVDCVGDRCERGGGCG